jgi:hypothetical protein
VTSTAAFQLVSIPHVVKGRVIEDPVVAYPSATETGFATPRLDLDELVWARNESLPAVDVPVAEVIDLLVATGERLRQDPGGVVQNAFEGLLQTSPYERRIIENAYEDLGLSFRADNLRAQLENELGGTDVVDGWRRRETSNGRGGFIRAFPNRLIHVLAGNSPAVAAQTVARGALMKGVHLLKMPSNDLLTATAVLRTMAAVAPDHPTVSSFSAVYWRGGDAAVEGTLFRAQFFDKIVAWGGDAAIRNAAKYLGPGFELISFDPKSSISMIGRSALITEESIRQAASRGAKDSAFLNQEACTSSRLHFVEGNLEQIDRYCEQLQLELCRERRYTSEQVRPPSLELREEISALGSFDSDCRVFGRPDGHGLVVRSAEPVDFYPEGKTVNVVAVDDLTEAMRYINVATQTVGVYPSSLKTDLRNDLASAGAQRVITLGEVPSGLIPGFPHDGFFPLHRFVRWVSDED